MKRTLTCAVMVSAIIMASSLTVAVPQVVALLTFFFAGPPVAIAGIALGAFITGFLLGVDTTSNLIIAL